jgi:hypothetical protein
VTWGGAYDQAIEKGLTEKQAIQSADSAVRLTQAASNPEDISRIEAGPDAIRIFTMFSTYFNTQANLIESEMVKIVRELGLKKGAAKLIYVYTMAFMLPAVLSEVIVRGMAGKFDEDDDDEYLDDIISIFFGSQARFASAMFPVVGPAINSVFNRFNNKWYDDRISTSPALNALESALGGPKALVDIVSGEDIKKKEIRDFLSLMGFITGAPVAPLSRPLGYLSDVSEGNANPSNAADYIRGLMSGKSGE